MFWRRLQQAIYYLSFAVFPLTIYIAWALTQRPTHLFWWVLLLLALVFIYARFVEPQRVVVRRERRVFREGGKSVRLVLISDLHLGVFKGERFLRKILARVREAKPDLVVIPGDLINDPSPAELKKNFRELGDLKIPVYVVTGNHDSRKPGYYTSEEVRGVLRPLVTVMDNARATWVGEQTRMQITGLSDLMEGKADFTLLDDLKDKDFNLIIAHNPDAAYRIPAGIPADLIVSGHTHAGQIFLPPLSDWLIPCKHKFRRGWYEVHGRPVYVSSGLGEVILPMRFLIPPEVVVMELVI